MRSMPTLKAFRMQPLAVWLESHRATTMQSEFMANGDRVTWYAVSGKILIIREYTDDAGWDAYTPVDDSNRIDTTLRSLDKIYKPVLG